MVKKVRAAEAKAKFSALAADVAHGGQHILIERHGKPLFAMVSVGDLERLEADKSGSANPRGALALVGAWREVRNKDIDSLLKDIYASRDRDTGRKVVLEA